MDRYLRFNKRCKLALLLLLCVVGMTKGYAYDFSAVSPSGQTLYYNIIDATNHYVELTHPDHWWYGYTQPTGNITLPSIVSYNGTTYTVTSIGGEAFSGCTGLTSIEIPNSVTSIGDYTFVECSSLTSIEIPNSVTSIGDGAFIDCHKLTSVNFPNSVTYIGSSVFYHCSNLASVTIPNSVTYIGEGAFYIADDASLPDSESLKRLVVVAETPPSYGLEYNPFEGVSNTIPVYVPVGSLEIYAMTNWYGFSNFLPISSGDITTTADPIEGGTVTSGGHYEALQPCTVLATANEDYDFAFWTENGAIVSFDDEYTFNVIGDVELVAHFVPEGNINFCDGTVSQICLANWDTNEDGGLSYVEAAYVTNLGTCFQENSEITSFDELQYFIGLSSICYFAFAECDYLTSIEIPSSVTSIGEEAFLNCNQLVSVNIPNSVTSIGEGAFYLCSSLTSIEIPNSVTSIGGWTFSGCSSLTSIVVDAGNTVYDSRSNCNAIIETATNRLIRGCNTTVIPNSVISIGEEAFYLCSSLTSIEIPNSVTSIGEWAFGECSSLTSIEIPNSVTSIGDGAFEGCSNLTSIEIPNSVTSIGDYAFYECSGLTSIEIPNSVTSIGYSAFEGCSNLTSIEIPNSVASIGNYAFYGCSSLTSLTIGNSVASIGINAFGCRNLASVIVLADIPPTLSNNVFYSVDPNIPVYVPCGKANDYQNSSWGECFSYFYDEAYNYYFTVVSNNETMGIATVMQEPSCDNNWQALVMAMPNPGYFFVNWTDCFGYEVSTGATDSFIVTGNDMCLVANFSEIPPDNYWTTIIGTQYNLTMSGVIYIDGVAQTSTSLEVGAFCGDECRGSARAQYFPPTGEYVVSLAVVSNQQSGEAITFRLYDHDAQQEFPTECVNNITFVANANFGEMGNWYPFAFNQTVAIAATVTPEGSGAVEGVGDYLIGTSCTLTATANTGYTFVNWTKNGAVVSTNASYTFTVTEAGSYVAHFQLNSYQITASATPSAGGSFSGVGTYNHGSNCTLTATNNTGYTFVNWTVNGEVVSTDNPYTFTVNGAVELTANFSLNSYDVTASANPTDGGTITGSGTYDHFSTCTLTATANTGYAFHSWCVAGEVVSTDNPYTFTVSGGVEVTANFDAQETTALAEGWTWWSTSIDLSDIDGLTMLEENLGHNGLMIKSANKFVQNYYPSTGYDYWFGQLTSDDFTNASSYMIQTSASCDVTMTGTYADPSDHPIQLYPGWTWIGYPCGSQQSATSAFAGFTPTANDKVKSQYAFSTYYDNYGWFPEFTMTPGEGYLYQSLASDTRTLTFANGSKDNPQTTNMEDRYWRNNVHTYADNMNVIAVVTINGEEQQGEDLELGAFVDGECRGSAVLKYFQPTDRWYAMLTVTGADGDQIEFGIIDKGKGRTSMTSDRNLAFQANAVVGELDEPYTIGFGTLGCVENNLMGAMHIYPNPIDRNTAFSIVIPETETVRSIYIVNMMGEVVAHETNLTRLLAIHAPGVYTIKVVCHSGNVYVGKLIVK